jgi:hypothetical protein
VTSRDYVQSLSFGNDPVERQRGVGFGEMVVASDLDRPVACVGDGQSAAWETGVQFDVAWFGKEFTGDHGDGPIKTYAEG